MYQSPLGLVSEQCLAVRVIDNVPEVRSVEIMRETNTMFCDEYGVRYSRTNFTETGGRGFDAWKLHHRNSAEALEKLKLMQELEKQEEN